MKGFLSTYLWAIVFGFGLKFFGGASLKDYRLWIFMFAMVFSVGLAKNQAKDEGYREAKEECRKK